MIIDSHVHIGRWMAPWRTGDAVADLVEAAKRCGIDRLCVSSLGEGGYLPYPTPEDLRAANDGVLDALTRFPGELLGYCFVSPEHPSESLEEIHRCVRDGPMIGVKLWIARKASDPAVDAIVEEAVRQGVPIMQHAWYKTIGQYPHESTPADVAVMARRHPDATILMAHLMGAGERGVQDIADCPNVLVDTSGSDPQAGMVEYAVRELGSSRIVFGSDAPGRNFPVQLAKVLGADLTAAQKEQILGTNMQRILRRGFDEPKTEEGDQN